MNTTDTNSYQFILESTLGIPFTENNNIEILKNGDEIFPAMLKAIKEAEKRIDFLTFVYWTGDIADKFANALAEKAREGVTVRIVLDSYGASPMNERLLNVMQDGGVQVAWMRPLWRWRFWKSDNRTHRKVLICDGTIAFTGGVGIAKEWEGDARNPSEWRDTHFKVQGPAVHGLHAAFIENWIETEHDMTVEKDWDNKMLAPSKIDEGNSLAQVIRTSATVRWSDIVMLYRTLFGMARHNIRITTAYFNPNDAISKLLQQKAEEGVEINIMMPKKYTDQRVATIAAEEDFPPLLESGVNLWYYQKTMLHAKIITIDDDVSCVGSANFNHRSMLKDDEVNMVVIDKALTQRLNKDFKEDLQHCEKVDPHNYSKRSPFRKVREQIVKMFEQQI